MKKLFKIIVVLLGVIGSMGLANAQDYKHSHGLVDKEGKVLDSSGHHIGWVTTEGVIKDSVGTKIAQVDAQGNLVDAKTGKSMGKASKNGTFVYYIKENKKDTLLTSAPSNGTCEVKTKKGETMVLVHENYKQYGACAYHCLSMKKGHKHMKMK